MNKVIALILCTVMMGAASAADLAHLKIKVTNPTKQNKYFLCLYGVGCLSIRAGDQGKQFSIMPIDMANIKKIVVTDVSDMSMHSQATVPSCQIKLKKDQTVTISGNLLIRENKPYIDNLRCSLDS